MLLTAVAIVLLTASASAAPATAGPTAAPAFTLSSSPSDAAGSIQVSTDGSTFTGDTPGEALFDAPPAVVPGDRVTAALWVRNGGDATGALRLSATDARSTSEGFDDALRVSAAIPPLDGSPVAFGDAADCAVLLEGEVLRPGETVAITLSLAFAADTPGRIGHGARASIDFVAALRDPSAPSPGQEGCSNGTVVPGLPGLPGPPDGAGGPGGVIAATGFGALLPWAAGATVLVGIGSVAGLIAARGPRLGLRRQHQASEGAR